ncbi:MAG: hypothetical protein M1818_007791 [Claussenomyces sp. TS43310]|nr:MAG: hypothetical protein M1818_007791 [Claussenomyces sp. TS43310]
MDSRILSTASSPLSDPGSDQEEDFYRQDMPESNMPPAKRQRVGDNPMRSTPMAQEPDYTAFSSISSDTSGSIPSSPVAQPRFEDDDPIHEQVTRCAWHGCQGGDFGNMDKLVEHIHDAHIEGRQKKYTCEWEDCPRKGLPHASAYALKSHMRSHTREKPFYCVLPECDRSFTRSDALAKHMRTVHETEALRPSDPIPKSMQPPSKNGGRLKLVIKQPHEHPSSASQSPAYPPTDAVFPPFDHSNPSDMTSYATDLGFTPEDLALESRDLFRLLRRQLHWAEEEADALRRECEATEAIRRKEWIDKEILLDQVIKTELDWHERRRMVLASLGPSAADVRAQTQAQLDASVEEANIDVKEGVLEEHDDMDDGDGEKEDQREAAAVLASMFSA